MKFQCLGYFNQEKMDALPEEEIDALMKECRHHLEELYKSGHVLIDAGVGQEVKILRRDKGKVQMFDGRLADTKKMLGSAFIIEANDMEEAMEVASLHPTVKVSKGEQLGWEIEIRSIDYFEMEK